MDLTRVYQKYIGVISLDARYRTGVLTSLSHASLIDQLLWGM